MPLSPMQGRPDGQASSCKTGTRKTRIGGLGGDFDYPLSFDRFRTRTFPMMAPSGNPSGCGQTGRDYGIDIRTQKGVVDTG
jgi:hypothetical protein